MGRPGVFYKQFDLSQVVVGLDSSVLGIAGNASWGPVAIKSDGSIDYTGLTLLSNLDQFKQLFGKPVSPSETPVYYQLLGWFKRGKSCYFARPQGGSKYGGAEALSDGDLTAMPASLSLLTEVPSGSNAVGVYSKYPGVHDAGTISVEFSDRSTVTGEWVIKAGIALTGGVLDSSDVNYEEHTVSILNTAKDGNGRSKFIRDVLERDSLLLVGRAKVGALVTDVPKDTTSPIALSQAVYVSATTSQIVTAYEVFESLSASTVDILIPGSFHIDVLNKVVSTSILRGDCFFILTPNTSETWTTAADIAGPAGWKSNITTLSWQGAGYAMFYKVKDEYNDREVEIPSAGYIAGAFAYNDFVAEPWYAPAGPRRGQQDAALGKNWTETEQDYLYDNGINFVTKSPRYGVTIQGQKTFYGISSALNRINVARLILKIKRDLMSFLEDFIYEFNNEQNRALIKSQIDAYLRTIQAKQGLYDFRCICDDTNNTPTVIDNNELVVDVYLKPVRVAEFLYLNSIITSTGVNFSDLISKNPA